MQSVISKFFLLTLLLIVSLRSPAEERPAQPLQPEIPNLQNLVARSGYAFAGTVKSIERIQPRRKDSVGVMQIVFQVDRGYLGVHSGQTLSIHEWAGLWEAGDRYRVGEHVVLFLYPPSRLGLTSPMPNGRFPVNSGGQVGIPSPQHTPTLGLPIQSQLPFDYRLNLDEFTAALRLAMRE
jgi:hypothetical protein